MKLCIDLPFVLMPGDCGGLGPTLFEAELGKLFGNDLIALCIGVEELPLMLLLGLGCTGSGGDLSISSILFLLSSGSAGGGLA